LGDVYKRQLQDVSLAIAKIEQGTYGICEATGDVIPLEQMSILPTARTVDDLSLIHISEPTRPTT
ncbi:hypothetical protein H8G91_18590, partial [Bacillus pumilus]|nr:hypothetical protein [Bacillus pumilus]